MRDDGGGAGASGSVVSLGRQRPAAVAALWPLGPEGQPERLGELGRRTFQQILETAPLTPGLAGDLVAASRIV